MNAQSISRTRKVQTFEELDVYQRAFALQQSIFEATKRFPKDEIYSLSDQVRRSSRSIGANIAEAWAKRRYPASFVSKLSDSDGELQETLHWLRSAMACNYIDQPSFDQLMHVAESIGAMLGKMMANHTTWCTVASVATANRPQATAY